MALPAGVTFDTSSGVIVGTPTETGSSFGLTVKSTSAGTSSTLATTLVVSNTASAFPVEVVTTSPLNPTEIGSFYLQKLIASGGDGTYVWSSSEAALPSGLTLDTGSGVITGIPLVTGSYSFMLHVTSDSTSSTLPTTMSISNTSSAPPVSIITTSPLNPTSIVTGKHKAIRTSN